MTSVVTGFGRIMTYAFNGLDMSSAANDVIVVQHRDGTLHSSPFHVRFGKFKVLRPQDKVVSIEVNGEMTRAVMKIGSDGDAYWLEPTDYLSLDGRGESPVDPLTSPLLRQQAGSPQLVPSMTLVTTPPGDAEGVAGSTKGGAVASPPTSPKKTGDLSEVPIHIDVNRLNVVDPLHLTIEHSSIHNSDVAKVSTDDTTALDVINTAGDEELRQVLGPDPVTDDGTRTRGTTAPPTESTASTSLVVNADAASASALPSTQELFVKEMSLIEKQKYDELLRSFAGGGQADGGDSSTLMLSKLASYDDITGTGESASTPSITCLPSVGVPSLPETPVGELKTAGDELREDSVEEEFEEDDGSSEGDEDDELEDGQHRTTGTEKVVYYKPTITPISADLDKLHLKPGHNRVRYVTHTSLQGRVVMESNIFLWPWDTKIVVSDIDGTITKSDVWGHILPMIGRDWTHSGICSLYTKVANNGYQFVYLTARSMSQQEQTRKFLWGIEQDGMTLPRGPVMTAPDRFFTALRQEVSKKAHEFKISCLHGISSAFPRHCRPFYAGFGNRMGDVISYTATAIPKHKIFIIDTNSTLHVCRVKQTYKNLAHLVDVTFPPLQPSEIIIRGSDTSANPATSSVQRTPPSSPSTRPAGVSKTDVATASSLNAVGSVSTGTSGKIEEELDADYNSFNFWRIPPEGLLVPAMSTAPSSPPKKNEKMASKATPAPAATLTHPSLIETLPRQDATQVQQHQQQQQQTSAGNNKSWLPRWLGGKSTTAAPQPSSNGGPTESAAQQPSVTPPPASPPVSSQAA